MEKKDAEMNFKKMYLIRAIRSGMFSIAIIMPFYGQNGLKVSEAMTLQALFAVALMILEVPTGYFADRYGRKKSIIIGSIFSTFGYLAYSMSYGFQAFLVSEIILAVGCSFVSGADSALLYDTRQESPEGGGYIKLEGNSSFVGLLSEGLTSFVGGSLLALISLRVPIYCDAALAFLAVPVACTLIEPPRHTVNRESSLKVMWRVMKYSLHGHTEIKWLIIFSSVVSAATLNMVWLIQVYWANTGVPLKFFGAMWASLLIVAAIVASQAHRIEDYLERRISLVAMIALPVAGYLILSATMAMWSAVFILLFYVTRGMNDPITKSYINGLVSSDDRATILSVRNLIGKLIFSIVVMPIGMIHDTVSLQGALGVSGGIFLVGGVIALFFLRKHGALK